MKVQWAHCHPGAPEPPGAGWAEVAEFCPMAEWSPVDSMSWDRIIWFEINQCMYYLLWKKKTKRCLSCGSLVLIATFVICSDDRIICLEITTVCMYSLFIL